MSTNQYKKSYEGDYTKKYHNYISWIVENKSQKLEYQNIRKKISDTPYNKKERSSIPNTVSTRSKEAERVYADGRGNKTERGQIKRNWDNETSYTPTSQTVDKTTSEKKSAIELASEKKIAEEKKAQTQYNPSPLVETKEEPKPWRNAYEVEEEEDDGNYNYHNYPIEDIGNQKYKNLKTNKEINLDAARNVLKIAGYEAKPNNNMGAVLLIFVAANVVLPTFSPIIAIGYGLFRMKIKTSTTWVKSNGKQVYKYALPSTYSEIEGSKTIGKIAIAIGAIAGFVHYGNII